MQSESPETAEIQTEIPTWLVAVRAIESKKGTDIRVLDLTGITSFADYFVTAPAPISDRSKRSATRSTFS